MCGSLVRFHGAEVGKNNANRGIENGVNEFIVSLLGYPVSSQQIREILLNITEDGSNLKFGNLSSEERTSLRLVGIDIINKFRGQPIRVYTSPPGTTPGPPSDIRLVGLTSLSVDAHGSAQVLPMRFVVTFEKENAQPCKLNDSLTTTLLNLTSALNHLLPCLSLTNNNVVFIFPNEPYADPFLWANVETLERASSYWRNMFGSGYSEATSQSANMSAWEAGWRSDLQAILRESRDEVTSQTGDQARESSTVTVTGVDNAHRPYLDPSRANKQNTPIRYVIVKDSPIRAYQAVFTWLSRGCLDYANIGSVLSVPKGAIPSALCSPQYIYCLAHLLEMEALGKDALSNYASQLTAKNALNELFSESSYLYPELKQTAMSRVVQHWTSIKAAGGLATVMNALEAGEADCQQMSRMALELLARV